MKHEIKQSILIASMAILLDYLFHRYYSMPMETVYYFFIKFFVIYYVSYYLLEKFENKKYFGIKSEYLASIIFALIFSIYYRFIEYIQGNYFGSRVPDVLLFGQIFTFEQNYLLLTLIWGIVHAGAFFISYKISKEVMRL